MKNLFIRMKYKLNMNNCSYFIKDKALFGSYPTQQSVEELEQEGVRYFIDLTCQDEKHITPYKTKYTHIKYPITDRSVPEDIHTFCLLVLKTCEIIRNLRKNDRIYINCRGGHGRSGLLVASILCYIFNLTPYDALIYTSKCHSNRSVMREKWRKIGAPQTYQQKKFIYKLFQPINMNKIYKYSIYNYKLYIKDNTFLDVFHAYNYFKEMHQNNPKNIIFNELDFVISKSWDCIKEQIMKYIVLKSFDTNPELKENLINSYLRPIIAHLDGDSYWGIGKDNTGQNRLGHILDEIRLSFIL